MLLRSSSRKGFLIVTPLWQTLARWCVLVGALGLAMPYLFYPALLWGLGRGNRDKKKKEKKEKEKMETLAACRPKVSLVLTYVNEGPLLTERIENLFDTDWPHALLEVIAVSDDADSRSRESLREAAARRKVVVLDRKRAQGKTACQNAGVEAATGEVLVFTDANTRFTPRTLPRLVEALADPTVGCAAGRLEYDGPGGGETAYWSFETWLRQLEARVDGPIGAHGAVYALRRADYVPLPDEVLGDLVEPLLQRLIHGRRTAHVPEARAFETPPNGWRSVFRRKRRIFLRAWHSLRLLAPLANPWRHPLPSIFFLGHKLLRWLSFVFLALLFLGLPLASTTGTPFVLLGEGGFFAIALLGLALGWEGLPLAAPLYLLCLWAAQAAAFAAWLRGETAARWVPQHG